MSERRFADKCFAEAFRENSRLLVLIPGSAHCCALEWELLTLICFRKYPAVFPLINTVDETLAKSPWSSVSDVLHPNHVAPRAVIDMPVTIISYPSYPLALYLLRLLTCLLPCMCVCVGVSLWAGPQLHTHRADSDR